MFRAIFLAFLATSASAETATVSRVLDGDTIVIDYPCSLLLPDRKMSVRIAGIDTPESRANGAKCDAELRAGLDAKSAMKALVRPGSVVELTVEGPDKYACRIVASVALDGVDLGAAMIAAGHARPYDGGAKSDWCN